MAFKGGGSGGGGEVVPAGTSEGELLQWDGTQWVAFGNPTSDGQILSSTGGFWGVQGIVAPVAGNILQWDGDTWEPIRQTLGTFSLGSQGLINVASQFFGPVTFGINGAGNTQGSGVFILPFDCRIDRFGAYHANPAVGTANPVTYFVHVSAADTPLTVVQNTNVAGPVTDLVNGFDYIAFTPICVRASWPLAAVQAIRPCWTMRLRSRGLAP